MTSVDNKCFDTEICALVTKMFQIQLAKPNFHLGYIGKYHGTLCLFSTANFVLKLKMKFWLLLKFPHPFCLDIGIKCFYVKSL